METKKGINIFFLIIAIITGAKLYQHTDFHNWKLEKPALDIIYLLAFLAAVVLLIKDFVKRPTK